MFIEIECIPQPDHDPPQKTAIELVVPLSNVIIAKHIGEGCYARIRKGDGYQPYAITIEEYNRIKEIMLQYDEATESKIHIIRTG